MHIFNVWTIIIQSLNIKEWKLFELQIKQTWHTLRILNGKMFKFNTHKNEKICIKCAQNRKWTSSMYEQSLGKIWV